MTSDLPLGNDRSWVSPSGEQVVGKPPTIPTGQNLYAEVLNGRGDRAKDVVGETRLPTKRTPARGLRGRITEHAIPTPVDMEWRIDRRSTR